MNWVHLNGCFFQSDDSKNDEGNPRVISFGQQRRPEAKYDTKVTLK